MRILVEGLLAGSILSLSAVALVLVYRATSVLNFAQGALGMVGTFTFVALARSLPVAPALLVGLVLAALLSGLLGLAVLGFGGRRLEATVLTLGALGLLQAAAQLVFGGHPVFVYALFPATPVSILGAPVGSDEVGAALAALAVAGGTIALTRRTRVGLLARAVASRPDVAASLGVDDRPVVLASWVLAGALAAACGILLLTAEPSPSTVSLTLLVVQSFAAALVGRLVSLPGALLGGLLVGVLDSAGAAVIPAAGGGEAVVFVLMVLLLTARPPRPVRSAARSLGGVA